MACQVCHTRGPFGLSLTEAGRRVILRAGGRHFVGRNRYIWWTGGYILSAAAVGCGACPASLPLEDPAHLLSKEEIALLSQVWTDFANWTGGDRTCVGEVRAENVDIVHADFSPRGRRADHFTLAAKEADLSAALRWGLCASLVESEAGIEDGAPYPIRDAASFAWECRLPPEPGWARYLEAACGESGLSALDAWLLDEVYVDLPALSVDSTPLRLGSPVAWTVALPISESARVETVDVADDSLWIAVAEPDEHRVRVFRLSIGEEEPVELVSLSEVDGSDVLWFGGDHLAWTFQGGQSLFWIDDDGSTNTTALSSSLGRWGRVIESVLVNQRDPLTDASWTAVSLINGVETVHSLPGTIGTPYRFSGPPVPTSEGMVAGMYAADVQVDGDVVEIALVDATLMEFSFRDQRWTPWTVGAPTQPLGRLSWDALAVRLPHSVGSLAAAISVGGDRLMLSTDVCQDGGASWVVARDHFVSWSVTRSSVSLTAWPVERP